MNQVGKERGISGSLFGKLQTPRIVCIDGHSVEVNTDANLIVLKNKDAMYRWLYRSSTWWGSGKYC